MNQTKHPLPALAILFAVALYTGGCSLDLGRGWPPDLVENAPIDNMVELWSRLQPVYWTAEDGSKVVAPWHFWANPASSWLPDYAKAIYEPLRDADSAVPYTWRPFYDSTLRSPCLFYQTEDGEVRCLPGWVQMEPDDPRDGFYGESTCSEIKRWIYALPVTETHGALAQRFLVTALPRSYGMPRVYDQKPFVGRVWWKHLAADGSRPCEEVTVDRFRFFERGEEKPLTMFVKLGGLAVDGGPG